ncbi:hypothetical protein Agub_g7383 [Astrephomene gubernaculifera]|uniref:Globin n=1 Tax=Astrephomene gubernaculifera TaxID=47775 RepID=A0AAD3DRM9_9CHLO|nr:hypothetical protein Agub_g7383 [Astrephomene gubernaculifera]
MGNTCTHATDAIAHLVTEEEIHEAVKSIEEWQKAQAVAIKNGAQGPGTAGPLLQRVGGPDVVRKVVELFYKKLYGDPRLVPFLHDQDVMHLRAKQSAFISWLFGPPNVPYNGRSVRIAHLRIIKQRNFSPDDYDLGMKYFEDSMSELGAPESIIGEVMRRLKPFKDAFFTPSSKDPEEEARWAAEDRAREIAAQEAREKEAREKEEERQLREQEKLLEELEEEEDDDSVSSVSETDAPQEVPVAEGVVVQQQPVEGVRMSGAGIAATGGASGSRPASRLGPQCPFSGARLGTPTRPASSGSAAVNYPSGTAVPAVASISGPMTSAVTGGSRALQVSSSMAEFEAELEKIERTCSPPSGATSAVQVAIDVDAEMNGGGRNSNSQQQRREPTAVY